LKRRIGDERVRSAELGSNREEKDRQRKCIERPREDELRKM
jgi:hypothetical protein